MKEMLRADYEAAKAFWNTAFAMNDEEKKEAQSKTGADGNGEELAPSEKLFCAVRSLGSCEKVLDYGCGRGWAAIIAAKGGCGDVTAVELSENAVESAKFYVNLFGVEDRVRVNCVSEAWIGETEAERYDGIVCSNVLDVIPGEVAESVVADLARVARRGARVVVGLNYYMVPREDPERKMTVKDGSHVYLDGILRLVCRTDEEWAELFSRCFTVEKLEHFAWPGEETERRRLFYLRKE